LEKITPGALYIVSTPIGNLGDITLRAIHILKSVSLIAAEDTRTSNILLKHFNISTPMIPFHSYNQTRQTQHLIRKLKNSDSIALISDAGTPGILDPAHILVKSCIYDNIKIIPVPGPSAFLAALVVSGLPTHKFVFEGFLPTKKGRQTRIKKLVDEERTIVFYESPHRLNKTATELLQSLGDRNCVMGREITKKFEHFFRGRLSELLQEINIKSPKGEIVLLVAGKSKKDD
jgi:16S rRNA (cytidine1402-2'-O)-methyltransferase